MIARFSRGVVRSRLINLPSPRKELYEREEKREDEEVTKYGTGEKKVGWLGVKVGDIKYASVTIRIMKEVTDKDGGGRLLNWCH